MASAVPFLLAQHLPQAVKNGSTLVGGLMVFFRCSFHSKMNSTNNALQCATIAFNVCEYSLTTVHTKRAYSATQSVRHNIQG